MKVEVLRSGYLGGTLLVLAAFLISAIFFSCPSDKAKPAGSENGGEYDLLAPVPPKEKPKRSRWAIDPGDREGMWKSRCGQCHDPERGLGKFVGEQWKPIIERMMKKEGAFLNAALAREIYFYLYEKTTGEKSPEEEEAKDIPPSSAGMQQFGD